MALKSYANSVERVSAQPAEVVGSSFQPPSNPVSCHEQVAISMATAFEAFKSPGMVRPRVSSLSTVRRSGAVFM